MYGLKLILGIAMALMVGLGLSGCATRTVYYSDDGYRVESVSITAYRTPHYQKQYYYRVYPYYFPGYYYYTTPQFYYRYPY